MADAKNRPVVSTGEFHTKDHGIEETNARTLKSSGDADDALEALVIRGKVDNDPEKAAMEAFMREFIEIRFATTTDPNAAQIFETNVNNNPHLFRRGGTYKVRRFVADHLLRLKETWYEQREVMNAAGEREFSHIPHTGLKYDFAIVHDPNPKGESWRRATMALPG